jgi:hypothetical protein
MLRRITTAGGHTLNGDDGLCFSLLYSVTSAVTASLAMSLPATLMTFAKIFGAWKKSALATASGGGTLAWAASSAVA